MVQPANIYFRRLKYLDLPWIIGGSDKAARTKILGLATGMGVRFPPSALFKPAADYKCFYSNISPTIRSVSAEGMPALQIRIGPALMNCYSVAAIS